MSQSTDFGGRRTPGFAKGIMVLQTLVILLLSSWIVEEYLNNIYLQAYVNDQVQAYGAIIAILVIIGTLGLAFGLLKVLRSTHKQIGALVNPPEAPNLPGTPGGSTLPASGRKSEIDLHPMVAALKADLAHQSSMQPIPPLEVKEAATAPPMQAPPSPPPQLPVKTITGTPSTVITGSMPVLKRVNQDDKNQGSH